MTQSGHSNSGVEKVKMRQNVVALLFLFCFSATVSDEVADQVERLSILFADDLSFAFGQLVDMAYSESNISQSESDQIRDELSTATADCVVDSLVKQAKEQSLNVEKFLMDAEQVLVNHDAEAFSDVLVKEELGEKINLCVFHAYEKVGARF